MWNRTAAALALAAFSLPVLAMNQCLDTTGHKSFTDLPCPGVTPAQAAALPGRAVASGPADVQAPATPPHLPLLTAGQGAPRELVTALYRCLEAASSSSQRQFRECSWPEGSAHQLASNDWRALLVLWREQLPQRLLASSGSVDKAERNGQLELVDGSSDRMDRRLSASFARHEGRWKLVSLRFPLK
ncbi:hypothetical protein [Hydrogenophaga sp. RWCD_12]|uniref:hypothetical protein n=1 Tax=Hydrogenophaga sp. RWCD_12 TaxID=3391190 RepID=UPI003984B33E